MRFSTVFVSSAVVLAGMSAALSFEKDDMLVARFADSDFEVEARGFEEEPELYARGGAISKLTGGNKNPPSYRTASRDPPPRYTHGDEQMAPPNVRQAWNSQQRPADYSNNHKTPAYTQTSRHRRSYYDQLEARGNTISRIRGGGGGDRERSGGRPPSYQTASRDPPPRYQASPNHLPHLDSFQRETDYSNNHKTPTGHNRRSFYDLD